MTKAPEFTLRSIPNQSLFKMMAGVSFVIALIVLAVAITLYSVKEIEPFTFNLLLAISGFMLFEAFIMPSILKKLAKGQEFQFFEDHLKYQTPQKHFFTIPYDNIVGVRAEPLEKTHHYKNKMVSDIFLKMDETKIPNFPNLYIKKGELKLPAIPDETEPLRKINAITGKA